MKRITGIIFAIICTILTSISNAQNISVQSFRHLPTDLDARVHQPKHDQNGQLAAIIKVVTTQTGFEWEPDMSGIVAVERKTGEYWLYVPRGARRLTIKHDQLGILRNFEYPIPIEGASVYEMVLATGEVEVVVRNTGGQWLAIVTDPPGASVFIDNQPMGTTPFQRRYPSGVYSYRLELPRYHPEAGRVELSENRESLNFTLKPRFGSISVASKPEEGMSIYLNEENTGFFTPAFIHGVTSGEYSLRLMSQWYKPQVTNISVSDNDTTFVEMHMQPIYGTITFSSDPPADILIDGSITGNGTFSRRMLPGVYEVSTWLDRHHVITRSITVEPEKEQLVNLHPRPISGTLEVNSVPGGATVIINGIIRGNTPLVLQEMIIDEYDVWLKLEGYETSSIKAEVSENQRRVINGNLSTGFYSTIRTRPEGAALWIGEDSLGITPWKDFLTPGRRSIRLDYGGETFSETIQVEESNDNFWDFFVEPFDKMNFTESASGLNIEMIAVRGGSFLIGCTSEQGRDCNNNERPAFNVVLGDYYIGKYPVTQRQWRMVMGNNPSRNSGCDECPVERVSWNEIQEFLTKLNELTGKIYSLPAEAQWEYAARGGSMSQGYKYSGSNRINDVAWYSANSGATTHKVGQKLGNELGIYDMSGNVWEFCNDWYGDYSSEPKSDPKGPSTGQTKVYRGGNAFDQESVCRVSSRDHLGPNRKSRIVGFRIALVP